VVAKIARAVSANADGDRMVIPPLLVRHKRIVARKPCTATMLLLQVRLGGPKSESFFSSLKTERIDRRTYRTRDEVRADVFDYIEHF
jgi:transposase InsO family protein